MTPTTASNFFQMLSRYLPSVATAAGSSNASQANNYLQSINELFNPQDPQALAKGKLDAAQQAYDQALAAQKTTPSAANSRAVQQALNALKAAQTANASVAGQAKPQGLNELALDQFGKVIPQLTQTASSAVNAANPALAAANQGAADVVNSINLNGLSPGEANAVERSLNQTNTSTGNLGLVNPTNTIANAMNFGGAFNNKVQLKQGAVNTATNAANATTGAVMPLVSGSFNAPNANTGAIPQNAATTFNTSAMGSAAGVSNAGTAANASMENANSIPSYLGAVCCFIFLEAYGNRIPKCVRKGRDKYYAVNPDIAVGYRRMAKWLVPLMQASPYIRNLVLKWMVTPITTHLHYPHFGTNKKVTHFWLKLWGWYGKGHTEPEFATVAEHHAAYV